MFCKNCGKEIDDNAKFCMNCGNSINEDNNNKENDKVNKILEDLKKSRESLNNTPYYCFPFYEYNNRAVELVEKAGFRMAFIGGSKKVYPGDNLYKIHRYELDNTTTIQEFSDMIN